MSYLTHGDLDNRDEQNAFFTSKTPSHNNFPAQEDESAFKINELSHRLGILENKIAKIENYLHRLSEYQNKINHR